jgi:hypothetical protein
MGDSQPAYDEKTPPIRCEGCGKKPPEIKFKKVSGGGLISTTTGWECSGCGTIHGVTR